MRRVLDCMIDQGVDSICILANYSEQFFLADEERDTPLDLCLSHVAGRVPVIVTCSHFSTRIASARAKRAAAAGAKMLMLMPPYHGASLRADEKGIVEHFAAVATAAVVDGMPTPLMMQDAPLSGVALPVPLLARMAREIPQLRYFKIEAPSAAAKLRALIEAGGGSIAGPFDGSSGHRAMDRGPGFFALSGAEDQESAADQASDVMRHASSNDTLRVAPGCVVVGRRQSQKPTMQKPLVHGLTSVRLIGPFTLALRSQVMPLADRSLFHA